MVIVTLCLFAVVGLGLGVTVRWPLVALISALSLFGCIVLLGLAGESLIVAVGKATAFVVLLEVGFLIGSITVDHGQPESAVTHAASSLPEAWTGDNIPSRASAVFRAPIPGLPPDDGRA